MATYEKFILSASASGRAIKLVAIVTPGTLIHTAPVGVATLDEVWLWMVNNHTSNVDVALEWGGVTSPDDLIQFSLAFKQGLFLIVPGALIQNSLEIRAFASVANVVSVHGFVNRITP